MVLTKPTKYWLKKRLSTKALRHLLSEMYWLSLGKKLWVARKKRWPKLILLTLAMLAYVLWRFIFAHASTAPYNAIQYGADHQTQITTGAYTADSTIYLDTNVGNGGSQSDVFTPKAEVRDTGTAFNNTSTNTGPDVQYDSNIPDKRRGTDMVYDSVNKRAVVFGGFGGDTGTMVNLNDVWVLSLTKGQRSQWKKLSPSGTPPTARRALQLIYDSANSRVILYGGYDGTTSDGTVYALSMTPGSEAWSTVTTTGTGPTLRVQHAAIYDAANLRMLVYGGRNDGGTATSLTLFQLTLPISGNATWSQPTVSGAPATGRELTGMIYDPVNQVAWMHGGCVGSNPSTCTRASDIWKLTLPSSGTLAWTQTNTTCGPFTSGTDGVNGHAMGYDSDDHQAVIWGGKNAQYQASVYTFNLPASGSPTCTDHSTDPLYTGSNTEGNRPNVRALGSTKGVYDADNKRMLFMFGYDGTAYTNETFVFDNLAYAGTWQYKNLVPVVYKRARDGNIMMYDSINSMIYEFGGASRYTAATDSLHVAETWRLNTSGSLFWADAGADTAPFAREFGNFIYDTTNQRGVYCFGLNHGWVTGDCWQMTTSGGATGRVSWNLLPTSNSQTPLASTNRWGAAAVYDSANNRMVVFGGVDNNNSVTALNDVQVLNLPAGGGTASWSQPAVSGTAPSVRQLSGYVYDPVHQRMIVFGGETAAGATNNEVWELTMPSTGNFAWRQMSPTGTAPSARSRMAMDYDPNSGSPRIIIFGGFDGTNCLNDVWQLTVPASGDGVWSQPTVTGTAPTVRRSMGNVLDPVNNRIIMSMGRNNTNFQTETYGLNLGSSMSWTLLSPDISIPVSIAVTGLSPQKYHWQIWATGTVTGDTPKTAYGGNSDIVIAATDFTTTQIPSITNIAPSVGPASGGTPFTITGSSFLSGATVTIGGSSATNVFVVSSTKITGISPSGSSGAQNVVVSNPLGDASTLTSAFTYTNSPYNQSTKTVTADFTASGSTLTNVSSAGIKMDQGVFQWLDSTPSTSGGSMTANTYYYVVTATDFGGGETMQSFQSRGIITTGSTGSVSLKWRPIPGATGYKVYRTTISGTYSTPSLINTISATNSSTLNSSISYTDTAATASSGAPPGSNTTNGEIQFNKGTVPSSGAGTFSSGPSVVGKASSLVADGAHAIQRPDGKFLVVVGNGTSDTSIYDPVANTFAAGPAVVGTSSSLVSDGGFSIQRPDGKFLVVVGNGTSDTSIYDPVANTFAAGPAIAGLTTSLVFSGAHAIQRPDGKFLVVVGNGTSDTSIYDPVANTFAAGPAIIGSAANLAGAGAHSIQRPDGKFLVILGNSTSNTSIYDPVANTFAAGIAVVGTSSGCGVTPNIVSSGAHAIQRPDGKFLVVVGNGNCATSVYDPIANNFTAGPAVVGALSNGVFIGSFSMQRPDGKFLLILANNTNTSIYDPVANTFAAGPAVTGASDGAHAFQRPDGKYVVINGGFVATTNIYDAGWNVGTTTQNGTVGTYISEDVEVNGSVDRISLVKTLDDSIQTSDNTVSKIEVKVATSAAGLVTASYINYNNGDTLPAGNRWFKVKITFRRIVPSWSRSDHPGSGVWLGESSTFENRIFATPDIQSITVTYSNSLIGPPTLIVPVNNATNVSLTPDLRLKVIDPEGDYVRYKIDVCSTSNCSSIVRTIDQTSSQTGWQAQSKQSATAYNSGQEAVHSYQPTALSANTQYWWRAYAIDPAGGNTFSSASSINTFTTGSNPIDVKIQGGTKILGGTKL